MNSGSGAAPVKRVTRSSTPSRTPTRAAAEICDDVKTRNGIFTVLDVEQMCSWALRAECCTSSWRCRRDLGDGSSERQGAQLFTKPSGPGVRWRLWPLLRQHCGEEASFLRA
jgi:hypothetical protein